MNKNIEKLLAAALTATILVLTVCGKKKTDLQGAVITSVKGVVSVSDAVSGRTNAAAERTVTAAHLYTRAGLLTPGMTLWTGPDAQADIQFRSGMVMRITGCSKVKLETARIVVDSGFSQVTVNLESGAVFARNEKLQNKSSFSVITPTAVASVRGTEFLVRDGSYCAGGPSGRTETIVQDGSVEVSDPGGTKAQTVAAGGKATMDPRGITLAAMSEADKKEIGAAGRDIQPVTEEGRSRLESVVAAFEENTDRFKEAIGISKTAGTGVGDQQEKPASKQNPETGTVVPSTKEPEKKAESTPETKVETKSEAKEPEKKKSTDTDNSPML